MLLMEVIVVVVVPFEVEETTVWPLSRKFQAIDSLQIGSRLISRDPRNFPAVCSGAKETVIMDALSEIIGISRIENIGAVGIQRTIVISEIDRIPWLSRN